MQLCTRYYGHPPQFNVAWLVDCWSRHDDISLETSYGNLQGPAAIADYERAYLLCARRFGVRQVLVEMRLELLPMPDAVTARVVLLNISPGDEPEPHVSRRVDHNDVVRTAEGWRFRRRRLEIDEQWLQSPMAGVWGVSHQARELTRQDRSSPSFRARRQ